jgi:hypothetical protein
LGEQSDEDVSARGSAAKSQSLSADDVASRAIHRRAVEAVIWGMPVVNFDLMHQEMVSKVKGDFNQILYWSRLLDWKTRRSRPILTLSILCRSSTRRTVQWC